MHKKKIVQSLTFLRGKILIDTKSYFCKKKGQERTVHLITKGTTYSRFKQNKYKRSLGVKLVTNKERARQTNRQKSLQLDIPIIYQMF